MFYVTCWFHDFPRHRTNWEFCNDETQHLQLKDACNFPVTLYPIKQANTEANLYIKGVFCETTTYTKGCLRGTTFINLNIQFSSRVYTDYAPQNTAHLQSFTCLEVLKANAKSGFYSAREHTKKLTRPIIISIDAPEYRTICGLQMNRVPSSSSRTNRVVKDLVE